MIHSFKVSNFYSIGEQIEVNLLSKKEHPNAIELYREVPFNDKGSVIHFVGGPNGSGKSNVLRVLAFMRFMIVDALAYNDSRVLPYRKFISMLGEPTTIEVQFSYNQEAIYIYNLELDMTKILGESLTMKTPGEERLKSNKIFSRLWSDDAHKYRISTTLPLIKELKDWQDLLNKNSGATVFAIFNHFDTDGILSKVVDYWKGIVSNILMVGTTETNTTMSSLSENALKYIWHNAELKDEASKILKKYDIGFNEIEKREDSGPEHDQTSYTIQHLFSDMAYAMPMGYESAGTQRMAVLLRYILRALAAPQGGVAVIDELDAFLHPYIVDDLLDMFMSPRINKNNAQLIFCGHSYPILNKLDKQQITFVKRNELGETEVWRLDSIDSSKARSDDNFYAKYLAGAYGGTPNLEEA